MKKWSCFQRSTVELAAGCKTSEGPSDGFQIRSTVKGGTLFFAAIYCLSP